MVSCSFTHFRLRHPSSSVQRAEAEEAAGRDRHCLDPPGILLVLTLWSLGRLGSRRIVVGF